MRDLILTAILVCLVPLIFRRPYIGALAWAWVSLMAPHRLTYGFAYNLPFAMVVALCTLITLLFSAQRKPLPINGITGLLITLVIWMSITTIFALNPDTQSVTTAWVQMLKIHMMLLVTMMLIRGRNHIEQLIWIIVVSIGYFGTKGGVFTVLTGGAYRVWGPSGTFIDGNNELALALVMLIPLMYYLAVVSSQKWVRWCLWGAMISCVFSVLGSHSRGALLAILGMTAFFVLKSNRPVLLSVVMSAVLTTAILAMPAEWFARMDTIAGFEDDKSANQRLNTWTMIWNMVQDRPLTGAGFRIGSDLIYQQYSPAAWGTAHDAHSIYFQALGEHGFPGLALFLAFGVVTWRQASRLAANCSTGPESDWVPLLMRMVQVSLIGFATGGTFLGLLHYDFPYYMATLVVLVGATVSESRQQVRAVSNPQQADSNS